MPPTKPKKPPARDPGRHAPSQQLRELIRARGYSATELAKEAGVDRRSVARFLAGSTSLGGATIDAVAGVLGLRWAEGPGRKKERPAPATDLYAPPRKREIGPVGPQSSAPTISPAEDSEHGDGGGGGDEGGQGQAQAEGEGQGG